MTIIDADQVDRFERRGSRLYRPNRIAEANADGHDDSWAVAYFIVEEDDNYLLCNFYSKNGEPDVKISKGLIV